MAHNTKWLPSMVRSTLILKPSWVLAPLGPNRPMTQDTVLHLYDPLEQLTTVTSGLLLKVLLPVPLLTGSSSTSSAANDWDTSFPSPADSLDADAFPSPDASSTFCWSLGYLKKQTTHYGVDYFINKYGVKALYWKAVWRYSYVTLLKKIEFEKGNLRVSSRDL
jgi:hypothetical protein